MSSIKRIYGLLRGKLSNNGMVLENYFFMTVLQVLNMCFYILIYPFLIRTIGVEGYGLYAYAASIVLLFITFLNFGFDLPAAKRVAEHAEDKTYLQELVSVVFFSKIALGVFAAAVFVILLYTFPIMCDNKLIFSIVYIQTFTFILFPQWYYQGLQKMKVVTLIQLTFRLLSLPVIFFVLKTEDDVWIFSLIVSISSLLGGITSILMIRYQDGLMLHFVGLDRIKNAYKESIPFFLSNVTGVVKEQGIVVLIGSFLGMKDVAIYDLAYKIIIIPRTLFSKLNDAFYPKLLVNRQRSSIVQILKAEFVIGVLIILGVVIFGKFAVSVLGGEEMSDAYYVCIILSVTVMGWLLAGAYIQFCFIPEGYSSLILHNQIVALVSCFLISGIGLYIWHNVYALVVGIASSSICEIVFCCYIAKKYRML